METKKIEGLSKGSLIKADLYSRPNALNGKYRAAQIGMDSLAGIKDSNIFLLETLKMKADLADKIIAHSEDEGLNTSDPDVMKSLGEKVNAAGTPVHRSESVMTAMFVSLQLMAYYGIAIGFWGLAFKQSFLSFGVYGGVAGLALNLLSAAPVVASQRTRERVQDMSFAAGATLGNLGIVIGVLGIVAWVISAVFF